MSLPRALGTLPNLLSFSRVILAVAFVASDATATRIGLIVVAATTDFLDGWIARRSNLTSRWGALIDPLADRVFVLTAVATCLLTGALGTGGYFILIMRDLATALGFLVARVMPWLRTVQFKARVMGKVVTVLQLVTIAAVIGAPAAVPVLLACVATTSLVATGDYTLALWRARTR